MLISKKLYLLFTFLIIVIGSVVVLNEVTTSLAKSNFTLLRNESQPVLDNLTKYNSINSELKTLLEAKLENSSMVNRRYSNKILGILEVEYPNLNRSLRSAQLNLLVDNEKVKHREELIESSIKLDLSIRKLFEFSNKSAELGESYKLAKEYYNVVVSRNILTLKRKVVSLRKEYQELNDRMLRELAENLDNTSLFIKTFGIIGVLLCLIAAFRVIKSIIEPLQELTNSTNKLIEGEYGDQVIIKGSDELATLGTAFNSMSFSLEKAFTTVSSQKGDLLKVNESLNERRLALEASNKELEEFAYVASHDLQEPVRVMLSFSKILDENLEGKLEKKDKEFLGYIVEAGLRMQTMIKDLLDYSRLTRKLEEKTLKEVDLNQTLKSIQQDLSMVIKESSTKIIVPKLPLIIGFESQLYQLFLNLISNAIKYRKEGESPEVEITVKETLNHWKFSVSDNGIGMKEKYLERIFIIFQRLHTQDEFSGTGIGLAICKKIVKIHKGEISVSSQEGKGSTFSFTIEKMKL